MDLRTFNARTLRIVGDKSMMKYIGIETSRKARHRSIILGTR